MRVKRSLKTGTFLKVVILSFTTFVHCYRLLRYCWGTKRKQISVLFLLCVTLTMLWISSWREFLSFKAGGLFVLAGDHRAKFWKAVPFMITSEHMGHTGNKHMVGENSMKLNVRDTITHNSIFNVKTLLECVIGICKFTNKEGEIYYCKRLSRMLFNP